MGTIQSKTSIATYSPNQTWIEPRHVNTLLMINLQTSQSIKLIIGPNGISVNGATASMSVAQDRVPAARRESWRVLWIWANITCWHWWEISTAMATSRRCFRSVPLTNATDLKVCSMFRYWNHIILIDLSSYSPSFLIAFIKESHPQPRCLRLGPRGLGHF